MLLYLTVIADEIAIIIAMLVIVETEGPYMLASKPANVEPNMNNPKLDTCNPASLPLKRSSIVENIA